MAKQPYIPLYIGDWEQDTNCLSLEAEAAWLKIVFKMFKGDKSGVYKTSTNSLQKLWRCEFLKVGQILDELKENDICNLEISEMVVFGNRRMIREKELSEIRTKAVQNRYKTPTKGLHPLEYDNDNGISDIDINTLLDTSTYIPAQNAFLPVYEKMMNIFLLKFSGYFTEESKDRIACEIIAGKIEKIKGWAAKSSLNGHLGEMLVFWGELVDYIAGDAFLRKFDLAYHSTKGWQRRGQHMNNVADTDKPKKEEKMSDYQKEIEEKREKARHKKSQ